MAQRNNGRDAPFTDLLAESEAWLGEAAAIIEIIDRDDLPQRLVESIGRAVPVELAGVFLYRGRSRPLCLYDNFDSSPDPRAKAGIGNYVDSTYVLNPFYLAHRKGVLRDAVYRMRDLAPDAYFRSGSDKADKVTFTASEEIGFITDGWPRGLEEAIIAVPLEAGVTGELCLFISVQHGGFTDAHLADLDRLRPLIASALRKFWLLRKQQIAALPPDSRMDDAFEAFGRPALSLREREVVQLVLRGHSSESIGYHLGISVTTVKTHRKRAYAKLGISSQSELFMLFLEAARSEWTALGP